MASFISNFQRVILVALLLQGCTGDILFRTAPCSEGQVRKGDVCVSESTVEGSEKLQSSVSCKDPDLNKVHKGETVTLCNGSLGEGKYVPSSDLPVCTKDGEQDCVAKSSFKVVDTSKLEANKIANGTTIAGITGSLKAVRNCRNYTAMSTFDSSYPPSNFGWYERTFLPAAVNLASDQITFTNVHGLITNSPVRFTTTTTLPAPLVAGNAYYAIYISSTVIQLASVVNGTQIDITTQGTGTHTAHDVPDSSAQYFDTIDDFNGGSVSSPSNNPWSSSDYLCDSSNFLNVTSTSAPLLPSGVIPSTGTQAFTQIWQDQITGLYITNILSVAGGRTWADAIRTCESLNGGSAGGGWRLPTQKELMHLYIHGISRVVLSGGSNNTFFWSSSGISNLTHSAWAINLAMGTTYPSDYRYNAGYSALCVR